MRGRQNPWVVAILAVGLTLGGAALGGPVADLVEGATTPSTASAGPAEATSAATFFDPLTASSFSTATSNAPGTTGTTPETAGTNPAPETTKATAAPTVMVDAAAEATIGALADDFRTDLGLPALQTSPDLAAYAEAQAVAMATAGELFHGPIAGLLDGWVLVGENVGMGGSAEATFDALISSSAHAEILSNPAYEAEGVGAARDAEGNLWVCQVVAATEAPAPTTTITVPPEPTVTTVTLPDPTTTITLPDPTTTLPLP